MSVLSGKKILLGISGGIAAYKTPALVRLLIKAGALVKVVMSEKAKDFVTPLTLSTLSKNPVESSYINTADDNAMWNNHVDLGIWADYMLIAPATANTLAKMAGGLANNLLTGTYLSARCPVFIAPAMDLDMYKHQTTVNNLEKLKAYGNTVIPAAYGELASGLKGEGRMAEPLEIMQFLENHLMQNLPLLDKKVLITAGPTYEAIDPVRYIGNHSSGLMGLELAKAAAVLGAEVNLILGPSELGADESLNTVKVVSADEMYAQAHKFFREVDFAVCAAAVSDFKPQKVAKQKIKKKEEKMELLLERTPDILASLGEVKKKQFLVGFALESENEEKNAIGKLKRKNLDAIVLNSLNDKGAGFGVKTNKVSLIDKNLQIKTFPLMTKAALAQKLWSNFLKLKND